MRRGSRLCCKRDKAGHQITLNVYGHSRGGIAALLLAKQLGNIDKKRLSIHLALLDPVPGNLIFTSSVDPFKISLATKTMDLRNCKPLRKVLALYPHIPLFAITGHAPLLVSYPSETKVQEEVVNGCHSQAENIFDSSSKLVMMRVEEFLVKNGTQLQTDRDYHNAEAMKKIYLACYKKELSKVTQEFYREAHSIRGLAISATTKAEYFNNHHKALKEGNPEDPVRLNIQLEKGVFSGFKRFFINYPFIGQAIKWSLMAFSVASVLFFTGGLAAISFLTPLVVKLGAVSLFAFSPAIGVTLAASWYGAVKPLLSWCANKFFYPHYAILNLENLKVEALDSTKRLIDTLGVERSTDHSSFADSAPYQKNYSYILPAKKNCDRTVNKKVPAFFNRINLRGITEDNTLNSWKY